MKFTTEPSAWIGAIRAVLICAVLFGLHLSDVQIAGIVVALELIGGLIVRQSTTTNQALDTVGVTTKDVARAINNETVIPGGTGTGPGK